MSKLLQRLVSGNLLNNNVLMLAILILAIILRIIFIDSRSLWLDEIFSLKMAENDVLDLVQEVVRIDNHPPIYYIILHYWISLFGDSELSLRAPSAIFSFLSVYFTYKVGVLLFNKQTAIIAGLLLSTSTFSIYYAQEARMYSFLAFASVVSVYFLLILLKHQTKWSMFNFVWSSTLLVYSHLYGLFILVAENIYILAAIYAFKNKTVVIQIKHWLIAQILIFLLSLPWFLMLINRILYVSNDGFWVKIPTLESVLNTFIEFSGNYRGALIWVLLMLLGMLSVFIVRTAFGRRFFNERLATNEGMHIFFLSLLLFTPIVLPYVISQYVTPIYIIRCTIAGNFAFYLLVANGIMHLRWRGIRWAALTIILGLSIKALISQDYMYKNAIEFREAVEYLYKNTTENDVVIICSNGHISWPFNYYAEKQKLPARILEVDGEIILPIHLEANNLWIVRRTDRVKDCQRSLDLIGSQFVGVERKELFYRNLGVTEFGK